MGVLSLIKAVPGSIVRTTGKMMTRFNNVKPQVMVGGGILIASGMFVLAIVNARKLDPTIEESNQKLDGIEQKKKDIEEAVNLSDEEKKEQLREVNKELNRAKAEGI